MQAASLSEDHYNDVLARLPPGLDLDALAFETGAIQRRRQISTGASLLRLSLARGPGGLSLSEAAAWGGMIGLAEMSAPGLKGRLDNANGFLDAILERLLAGPRRSPPLRWPGRVLCAADGSTISQRASIGIDWRVHGVYDLGRGRFAHLDLTDSHGAESVAHGTARDGEVRIMDRNYGRAPSLADWRDQAGGAVDFIARLGWSACALRTQAGTPFDLIGQLSALPDDDGPHEVWVQAKAGKSKPDLALRLVIVRKPPEAVATEHAKLRRKAQLKQKTLKPQSLIAAGFVILATSLPCEGYPAAEILAAYRLRGQIELAFKRLKSLLHIDMLPTRTAQASRSWLLAHLILAVLCDDITRDVLDSFPSGPV